MFDAHTIKKDFPILSRTVHGDKPLVYLDSAATSQKPKAVIDAIVNYYENHNANVHRGIHVLGDESTRLFHSARKTIAAFFGADDEELILVRNTTEALNMIAYAWVDRHLNKGDVILTTTMEHHSNIVPWQEAALRKNLNVVAVDVKEDGSLDLEDFKKKLTDNVKLIALAHVSNAIGTLNPIEDIVKLAHKAGAKVVVDGAQSAPHLPVDFHKLGADFFAFSGHKMLGPMGIGGLLVKKELLKDLHPFLFGGGMIDEVSFEKTTFADAPDCYIAGTPDVAGVVGLAAACEYLSSLGMQNVYEHDTELVAYALQQLQTIPEIQIVGSLNPKLRCGSVAFVYKDVHAHDVAQILDSEGVAVRSGHHCTMPLHKKFGWIATTRASFGPYSTKEDIDVLVNALHKVKKVFSSR